MRLVETCASEASPARTTREWSCGPRVPRRWGIRAAALRDTEGWMLRRRARAWGRSGRRREARSCRRRGVGVARNRRALSVAESLAVGAAPPFAAGHRAPVGLGTPMAQTGIASRSSSPATSPPYVGLGTPLAQTGISSCRHMQISVPTTPEDKSEGQADEDQGRGQRGYSVRRTRAQYRLDPSSHVINSVP